MTSSPVVSPLAQLAPVELELVAETEKVQTACKEEIVRARQRSEEALAKIPLQLQEERKELVTRTRAEAEAQAAQIVAEAEQASARLGASQDEQVRGIVNELVRMVIPAEPPPEGEGEQS